MNTGLDAAAPRLFTRCRRTAGLADRAASPGIIVELPIATEVLVILLLILANGVFAMSEIAVVAARKVRLQQRADDGDERAAAALQLANHPAQFLSTVQVGITLVGILAGAYGGATIAEKLAVYIAATVPQLAPYADGVALGMVVAVITFLSLIIGELVPKSIGLTNPETIASWVARPMMWLSRIGGPFVALLTGVHQSHPAHLRHQGPGRAAPDRRRDQGGHQPGRGDRRARSRGRVDRPARVPAGRSARRRRS